MGVEKERKGSRKGEKPILWLNGGRSPRGKRKAQESHEVSPEPKREGKQDRRPGYMDGRKPLKRTWKAGDWFYKGTQERS
jgi:hypothetical protein